MWSHPPLHMIGSLIKQRQRQKTIGFMSKTRAARASRFLEHFGRPLHDYKVKRPNATFYGRRGHATTNVPFLI